MKRFVSSIGILRSSNPACSSSNIFGSVVWSKSAGQNLWVFSSNPTGSLFNGSAIVQRLALVFMLRRDFLLSQKMNCNDCFQSWDNLLTINTIFAHITQAINKFSLHFKEGKIVFFQYTYKFPPEGK